MILAFGPIRNPLIWVLFVIGTASQLIRQVRVSYFNADLGWPAIDAKTKDGKVLAVAANAALVLFALIALVISIARS